MLKCTVLQNRVSMYAVSGLLKQRIMHGAKDYNRLASRYLSSTNTRLKELTHSPALI